MSLASRAA